MSRVGALLLVGATLAGCGGTSAKPTAATGCKGLRTAASPSSLSMAVIRGGMTFAQVCARFGAPQRVTRGEGGSVTWSYNDANRTGLLSFERGRVVEGAWFDRSNPNATYTITQSVKVMFVSRFSGGDRLHRLKTARCGAGRRALAPLCK